MKRRAFIALAAGAVASPLVARAQPPDTIRRVGVFMGFQENDPEGMRWLSRFTHGLEELGWSEGRNLRMEIRWAGRNFEHMQLTAKELVGSQPDVILSHGTPVTRVLKPETRTIPIVFVTVGDPVGDRFVESLPRPGGNITGFIFVEEGIGGKWLELLKEIAPGVRRAAAVFNPNTAPRRGTYYLPSFEAAARLHNVEPITAPVQSGADIESLITSLSREPRGGFVTMGDPFFLGFRKPMIAAATQKGCAECPL